MELTLEENIQLENIYGRQNSGTGYNPNKIEKVENLTEEEKKFFSHKNFISPYFSVQTLYKISGEITPIRFNRVVRDMVNADEIFRTNFCEIGNKIFKIIFAERRTLPDVIYRTLIQTDPEEVDDTLTKIMEADRRINFDLKRGNLIRFSIFKTGDKEFAVLVTISQLIANHFNYKNFFAAALELIPYKNEEKILISSQPEQIETAIREYWAKLLEDLPSMSTLPYVKPSNAPYNPKAFRIKIPADILSDLREKSKSSRVMLMTILQSAWGFFLQCVRKLNDVIFCQFSENVRSYENFPLNIIPVRQKSSGSMTVEQIITQQFRQLMVSQPYGFFDWDILQEILKGKAFDHFLSFVDFKGTPDKTYSETFATTEGAIVTSNSWDSQGMKLGVYFQYSTTNLSITFLYDSNKFFKNIGERFAKIYKVVLQQILVHWNSNYSIFSKKLLEKIKFELDTDKNLPIEDEKKIISDFIIKNPILQGGKTGTVAFFAESGQIFTKFEGDRISGEILEKNLIFVVEGKFARSLDTGDGWFKALDIISKGGWINENILLESRRTKISAEVLTEQAKILVIPLEKAESLFLQHPDAAKPFFEHILKQMEKYQLLWIES